MPKAPKKPAQADKTRCYYMVQPWEYRNSGDQTEIMAYVEASGAWEVVAVVQPTSGASAEALAAYITAIVNQQQRRQDLLQDAMHALELVMEDGLNFSSEQAVEHALHNIKKSG
jgi:hypothetical protein